jgi:hypothetical protein
MMPSKFTSKRRSIVIAVLASGGSRRTAATVAGVSARTLGRWIAYGEHAHPEGRWAKFREQVLEAEANPKLAAFPDVNDEPDVSEAWKTVMHEWDDPDPPPTGPLKINVSFGPTITDGPGG